MNTEACERGALCEQSFNKGKSKSFARGFFRDQRILDTSQKDSTLYIHQLYVVLGELGLIDRGRFLVETKNY